MDHQVNEIVHFLLCMGTNPDKQKIGDKEMREAVDCGVRDRETLINEAAKKLKQIFGFDLVHIKSAGCYYIVNRMLLSQESSPIETDPKELAKSGLLYTILMYLFLKSPLPADVYEVSDEDPDCDLWRFLSKLGIMRHEAHSVFKGDMAIEKLIGPREKNFSQQPEFIRNGWIDVNKIREGSDASAYRWGPRAKEVIDREKLLNLVCFVYDDKPEQWKEHYDEVNRWKETGEKENE